MANMTREEAIAEINSAISCALMGAMLPNKQYLKALEALSILAREPRKEPPTVDEVAGDKPCLCLDVDGDWLTIDGEMARRRWKDWMLIAWLPYSALPKGDV